VTKVYERLINNLELEEDGEEIATLINDLLAADEADLLKLHLAEAEADLQAAAQEVELTPREEAADRVVSEHGEPLSAGDLVDLVENEYDEVGEQFQSLRHRSHASDILNRLVEKGLLGKIRHRGSVYYVDPEEAVRNWFKRHGDPEEFVATELAEETGLPLPAVKDILTRIDTP
jgi:hypothetical protein